MYIHKHTCGRSSNLYLYMPVCVCVWKSLRYLMSKYVRVQLQLQQNNNKYTTTYSSTCSLVGVEVYGIVDV